MLTPTPAPDTGSTRAAWIVSAPVTSAFTTSRMALKFELTSELTIVVPLVKLVSAGTWVYDIRSMSSGRFGRSSGTG